MFSWPKKSTKTDIMNDQNMGAQETPEKDDDIQPTAAEIAALKKDNQEMRALLQNLEKGMGTQGGMMQGLMASMQKSQTPAQPPEDPFALPNLPDEKWDELSNKDMFSLLAQMVQKGVEGNNNSIMGELKKMQQHSNTQYGSSEKARLMNMYPDFMEWEEELVGFMQNLGKGSKFSPEEIYKTVRLQNAEKAKKMDDKYGMSGAGKNGQFRWGSMPTDGVDEPTFEITPFNEKKGGSVQDQIVEDVNGYLKFRGANSLSDLLEEENDDFY